MKKIAESIKLGIGLYIGMEIGKEIHKRLYTPVTNIINKLKEMK